MLVEISSHKKGHGNELTKNDYTVRLYIKLDCILKSAEGEKMMKRDRHLPLTETTFYILFVLQEPLHGYGIIQEIERLSEGQVKVAAGTMYGAIENLLKMNWIEEVASQDKRRRVYWLTQKGEQLLELEIERLKHLVQLTTSK